MNSSAETPEYSANANLGPADASFAVHKVGHLGTGTKHRYKIGLLQPALFHQVLDHLMRWDLRHWVVLVVIGLDEA
jgi:hypothetical protein